MTALLVLMSGLMISACGAQSEVAPTNPQATAESVPPGSANETVGTNPAAGTASAPIETLPPPTATAPAAGPVATPPSPAVAEEIQRVAPKVGEDGAHRITMASLKDLMNRNDVVLVDSRSPESYQESHAEGAINVPFGQVQEHMGQLPEKKWIVTYCT